jgi:hypothetical protein
MIGKLCEAFVSGMTSTPGNETSYQLDSFLSGLVVIIAFILSLVLIGLFGKLLWNNSVVNLFTFAKPAASAWHIVGLYILLALMG